MNFKATTIVPGGRYKYGEYLASGNLTSKVTSTIYGGNNTTSDIGSGSSGGGDTNTGGDTGTDSEVNNWKLYLSKTTSPFDGAAVAQVAQTDATSLVGLLGSQLMETYVGDITGTHTYNTATSEYNPALPANYGITGIPETGMVIVVTNNGDTGTTISITVDNTIPATAYTGTLQIPCAVSVYEMQDLEDSIMDWEKAYQNGKAVQLVLEYTWSISQNNGGSTADAYRLDLTNENASINCDISGNILTGATRPTCTAKMWYGDEAVTGVTYALSYPSSQHVSGVSINSTTGVITFNAGSATTPFSFDGTPLEITVLATKESTTWRKVMTISKAYPGADGTPATSYWLNLSADEVKVSSAGTYSPTSITATAMMQVGQDDPTAATGCTIYYGIDVPTPGTTYTAPVPTTSATSNLCFSLKKGNTIVDGIETVPVMFDGQNGQPGARGESVYRLAITNENASINCDSSGNILAGAVRPTCTAKLWYGSEPVSNATFGIWSANCSYTGVTINSSTGVITFNSGTSYSPFNFNTGYSSFELTVTAKTANVLRGTAVMTVSRSVAGQDGSAGRGITGVTEYYAINDNSAQTPTIWSTTLVNPTSSNPYLWNYEEIGYTSGQPTTTTPVVIATYTVNGRGISSITEYYAINNDTTSAPTSWSTSMVVPTTASPYLWNYELITYTEGSTARTNPVIIGIRGTNGDNGRSITGVTEYYAINNDTGTTPTSWSTSITNPTSSNPYLWNYEEIGFSTGSPTATTPVIIAYYTQDGKGISSITEYYAINNDTATVPTSWSTSMQVPTTGSPYLWNYELITYTDGSTARTDAVIIGICGQNGTNGRGITSVTEYYLANNDSGNTPSTSSTDWTTTIQALSSGSPYLWNFEKIDYTSGSPSITTPVIIAYYTEDGRGISSITEYYLTNNNSASTPSTSSTAWKTTLQVPTTASPYLWNYELVTYTDNTSSATTPVIIGVHGHNGTNGNDAVSYWIVMSATECKVTTAGTATPSAVTATAWKQVGENAPTAATEAKIYYGYNTTTPTGGGSNSVTINNIDTSADYITFLLKVDNVQRDMQTFLILKDGVQGRQGAAVRGPVNWYTAMEETDRRWCNGELTDNTHPEDGRWIDIIRKDNVYYYCTTSYTEAGADWSAVTSNWTSADTEFDFIATKLLLAQNAAIDFLTGNEIYLHDTAGTITAGAAGGSGISFWAGNATPGLSPFRVGYDGSLVASNANITGAISATSGTFAGYIQLPYEFISDLTPDEKLSASTVGVKYLSQTIWKGNLAEAPSGTAVTTSWCYYNTTNNRYYYYQSGYGWVLMTDCYSPRGYMADNRAYLIADGYSGSYGMGDGGMLVLPEPSAALNGFTYRIIAVPNIATRVSGLNPAISVMTANQTNSFIIYAYSNYMGSAKRLSFYGGNILLSCIKAHGANNSVTYLWALLECTGGVDTYNGTSELNYEMSYVPVDCTSKNGFINTVAHISKDNLATKDKDTIYFNS